MAQKRSSSQKSEKSLIPVVFTIGIIGWGFFAIARMTQAPTELIPYKGTTKTEQEQGVISSFKLWLLDKLTSNENQTKERRLKTIAPVTTAPLAIAKQQGLPLIDDPLEGASEAPYQGKKAAPTKNEVTAEQSAPLKRVKVYLYTLDKNGDPRLKSVNRDISGSDAKASALTFSIQGPTPAEEMRDFIDSFPAKPKVLSVRQQGSDLIIDFNDKFGVGVSHETMKFQIQQLLYTATQFQGVDAISIRINGKQMRHIGADGIAIPERITATTLRSITGS